MVNPCAECKTHSSAATVVNVKFNTTKLNPLLYLPLVVKADCTSFRVVVSVNKHGNVFCGAFLSGTVLQSVVDIYRFGASSAVDARVNSYLTLSGLTPDTAYDIYCYSNDFANHNMAFADALLTKKTISTACSRSIRMVHAVTSVMQYRATSSRPEFVFSIELDSVPTAPQVVSLKPTIVDCSTSAFLSNPPGQILFPPSFTFAPTSVIFSSVQAARDRSRLL